MSLNLWKAGEILNIIHVEDKETWNGIVKSFSEWDIYYLNEYACSLQLHGDGEPWLIYYEKDGGRICYVVMQQDLADFSPLSGDLKKEEYFDWTTPYGYGGPLTEGCISVRWIHDFIEELTRWCKEHKIVSQFFRFHPLLQNQKILEEISDVVYLKKTVYIDTKDKETIFQNMTPNNRNMVRKAIRNGIEILVDHGERVDDFKRIYEATMKKNGAEGYYYFEKEYFDYLIREMQSNLVFFYALYQGMPISASIFFYNETYMHYHLSGTLPEYRKLAAANLLLSKAADWAVERGIKKFHLGGGIAAEDSLFSFKKHFNRDGFLDFCIGKIIFDLGTYHRLVGIREKKDQQFKQNEILCLIEYRA